jgi:hypothetical protein
MLEMILGGSHCREQSAMWGKHVIIDMSRGDKERVRSARHIRQFVETLVETIAMMPMGRRCWSISPNMCPMRPGIRWCN